MPRLPPEESIKLHLNYINTHRQKLREYPEDIQANFLRTFGIDAKRIAENYLLLGNIDEARKWFVESVNYYRQAREIKLNLSSDIEGGNIFEMFVSSVLSGDGNLIKEVSINIINNPLKDYDLMVFGATNIKLYAMLVLDNPGIEEQQEKFNEVVKKYAKRVSGYLRGERETLEALTKKDREVFLEGIHTYIKSFPRSGSYRNFPLSLYAMVFIILAKDRGMDIDPRKDIDKKYHKYIPMGLVTKE